MSAFIFIHNCSLAASQGSSTWPDPIVPNGFKGRRGEWGDDANAFTWHCGESGLIDVFEGGKDGFAFVIGDLIPEADDPPLLNARDVHALITADPAAGSASLARCSGFFAWLAVLADGSIHAGGDPFGLFPIYYFKTGSVFGLSTSLRGFHFHPGYDRSIDPLGFSRHLIENGCSDEHTVEKGGAAAFEDSRECVLRSERATSQAISAQTAGV